MQLGVARSIEKEHPGGLNQEWKDRLEKSLEDLNKDVYGGAERFEADGGAFVERPADAPPDADAGAAGPPAAPECLRWAPGPPSNRAIAPSAGCSSA